MEEQKQQQVREQEERERAAQAQQEAREHAAQEAQRRQQELAAIKEQAPSTQPQNKECGENQCLHNGACFTKPAHAICAPQDTRNAWTCEAGYTDT